MPVYEYRCNNCRKKISKLVRNIASGTQAVCPYCRSTQMTRLFSSFAVHKTDKAIYEDILSDNQLVDGMMRDDPRALARWSQKMGEASGDNIGPEYKDMMERLERGENYQEAVSETMKQVNKEMSAPRADKTESKEQTGE